MSYITKAIGQDLPINGSSIALTIKHMRCNRLQCMKKTTIIIVIIMNKKTHYRFIY